MSRGLTTRLRKLEVKAGLDGDFEVLTRRMTDHELFEHSKAVSEALVAQPVAGLRRVGRTGVIGRVGSHARPSRPEPSSGT